MWLAFKALSWQIKLGVSIGVLAILLAVIGTTYYVSYNKGLNVSKVEIQKYETKSQELQKQLAAAQGKVDVRVVTEYKDRVAYVDRIVYKTRTVVETSVPEQFKLSKGWIYVYNKSVAGVSDLDATLAANPEPSGTSDKSALLAITENNGVCLANQAQLDSLQKWIRDTEAARNEVTK